MLFPDFITTSNIKYAIQKTVIDFIGKSQTLSYTQKQELESEFKKLNFPEDRIVKNCIDAMLNYSLYEWIKTNSNLSDLWQKTAIEAAKRDPQPEVIANNVLEEYLTRFLKSEEVVKTLSDYMDSSKKSDNPNN